MACSNAWWPLATLTPSASLDDHHGKWSGIVGSAQNKMEISRSFWTFWRCGFVARIASDACQPSSALNM
eukprot:9294686-Pyramimonas_sp.AAC.1